MSLLKNYFKAFERMMRIEKFLIQLDIRWLVRCALRREGHLRIVHTSEGVSSDRKMERRTFFAFYRFPDLCAVFCFSIGNLFF